MKALALVMALVILGGSVKGSPLVHFIQSHISLDCCHEDVASKSCHGDTEEDTSCCGDMGCECTCCVHIMIFAQLADIQFVTDTFSESSHGYLWSYNQDYFSSIFHPPALV